MQLLFVNPERKERRHIRREKGKGRRKVPCEREGDCARERERDRGGRAGDTEGERGRRVFVRASDREERERERREGERREES